MLMIQNSAMLIASLILYRDFFGFQNVLDLYVELLFGSLMKYWSRNQCFEKQRLLFSDIIVNTRAGLTCNITGDFI